MQVEVNTWVTVVYRLYDAQAEPLEEGERELTYLQGGYGAVFPKIESALAGRSVGERVSLYLEPEDTFGEYDAALLKMASRDHFPGALETGMTFESIPGEAPDGELYTVTDITDEVVILDGNHPLAGMGLRFDLEIEDLRAATEEEIAAEAQRVAEQPSAGARLH